MPPGWICSRHFSADQKQQSMMNRLLGINPRRSRDLIPEAVPNINPPLMELRSRRKNTSKLRKINNSKPVVSAILKDKKPTQKDRFNKSQAQLRSRAALSKFITGFPKELTVPDNFIDVQPRPNM